MGATAATAQDFPRKPVTIIASAAPGGGVDLITRTIARALVDSFRAVYARLLGQIVRDACGKLLRGEAVRGLLQLTRDGQRWAFRDYLRLVAQRLRRSPKCPRRPLSCCV